MSRFKIFAFIALVTLAFSIALVGHALAGEKVNSRLVGSIVKWEQVSVGDEEGHVIVAFEGKGIFTNLQGKTFLNGWADREGGLQDMNLKSGVGSGRGYGCATDRDGDKAYWTYEQRLVTGAGKLTHWEGEYQWVRGTGKFAGIQGKGTFSSYSVGVGQWYSDGEGEVELPR